jgi:hypothetical protein
MAAIRLSATSSTTDDDLIALHPRRLRRVLVRVDCGLPRPGARRRALAHSAPLGGLRDRALAVIDYIYINLDCADHTDIVRKSYTSAASTPARCKDFVFMGSPRSGARHRLASVRGSSRS